MEQSVYDRGIVNVGNLTRWARVMKKAQSGVPITVGFLGGSITQDSAATRHENCYAYRTYVWWKEHFPKSDITYINVGIGATTSQFGVARVEEDLLSKNPDVVFCEFSVNDENNDKFKESFEGLVRRILAWETEPALFVFNNVCYDTGDNAQEVHNEIAVAYELPVVSIKDSIYEEILLGNLQAPDITPDNLHPNDLGHEYVAGVITNLLDIISEQCLADNKWDDTVYTMRRDPITPNRFAESKRYRNGSDAVAEVVGFTADTREQNGVRDIFKYGYESMQEGAYLRFKVQAARISVQYRKTVVQPAPIAEAYIDGAFAGTLDANFDETWGDCLYLQDLLVSDKTEEHLLEIRLTQVPEECKLPFYFVSVITA